MPREMFVETTVTTRPRTLRSVFLTFLTMTLILSILAVRNLIAFVPLPTPPSPTMKWEITRIIVPKPPEVQVREQTKIQPTNPEAPPVEAPKGIPPEVPRIVENFPEQGPPGIIRGVEGPPFFNEPLPPPPAAKPEPAKTVVVGGNIKPPMKTRDVRPSYPPIAQSARVQGVVIIEATISEEGRVMDARILRSIPLLDDSALNAVRQWEFTPTLLNNKAVKVVMTVTVQFSLQ